MNKVENISNCSTCVHEEVCKFKDQYLKFLVDHEFYFDDKLESFLKITSPKCVHYVPKSSYNLMEV